jgi:hypothetical protein
MPLPIDTMKNSSRNSNLPNHKIQMTMTMRTKLEMNNLDMKLSL